MRRQMFSYGPANIVPAIIAFATIYFFTRILTPAEYGGYSFALSAVMIGQSALFYPLTVGATRLYAREEQKGGLASFIKSSYCALGLIAAVGGLGVAALLGLVPLGSVSRGALLLALSLLLLRGLVTLNQSINRMQGRVGLYTAIECAQPALGLLLGAGLIAATGPSAPAVMLGLAAGAALCVLANARPFLAACREGTLDRSLIVELARFGWPLALAFLTSCTLQYADRFIVGTLGTVSQLGVYAVAYSLVERPITMLCTSVSSATFPMAVRALEQQGKHAAGIQAGANGAMLLALTVPACAGLALCAGPLATLLAGPDYRADAAALIPIMALTALARGISTHFVDHAFHLAQRPAIMLQIYAPAAAVNIALDIIAVPRFGMFAAAWIALACQAAALAAGWLIGRRYFPLVLPKRDLLTTLVATAAMAAILASIRFPSGVLGLGGMIFTGAAAYAGCTVLLNRLAGRRWRAAPAHSAAGMRPLKLAIYMHDLSGGGVERMKFDLIRAFARAGHDVTLVLHARQGELVSHLEPDIKVVSFDKSRVAADLLPLIRYIRAARPDFLISSLNHQNVIALAAKALTTGPTRVIICQHNALSTESATGWKYRAVPPLYRALSAFAAGFVAVSEGVAGDVSAASGIRRDRISVIYNPTIGPGFAARLAEPAAHPWFHDSGPAVFVTAGRLVPQKDHAALLRAFALHRTRAAARLMILGAGPLEAELRRLAADLGITDSVAFAGFVANPLPYMREAAAFLLTSRYEGFGNVLVEAMGCGTPVVAFDCAFGPAEILAQGRYGRLVEPGDIEAFSEAISATLREVFPAALLKARAGHFTAEASANGYLSLIGTIDAQRKAA